MIKKYKKRIIIICLILILSIVGFLIYKFYSDSVFRTQILDYNAKTSYEVVQKEWLSFNDDESKETLLDNIDGYTLEGEYYPLGDGGSFGDMINTEDMTDGFNLEDNSKNNEELEFLNKSRLYLMGQLQKKMQENVSIVEISNEVKDDILYKKIKAETYSFYQMREVWQYLSNLIYFQSMNKEYSLDNFPENSFFLEHQDGKLFEILKAQNKAMEIIIENFDDFVYRGEWHEFTLTYKVKNNKWVLQDYDQYILATTGYLLDENNPADMDGVEKMQNKRKEQALQYFDEIKNNEDIFKLNIDEETINKQTINYSEY